MLTSEPQTVLCTQFCTVEHNTYDRWGHLTVTYRTSSGDTAGTKANWKRMAYDASGRVSTITNRLWTPAVPTGQVESVITYRYDGKGRLITTADSTVSGRPALNAYEARDYVIASWHDGVTSYADSKADQALLADGVTSAFDAVGNVLRRVARGDSLASTFTYTDTKKVLCATSPDGTWIQYGYDALGDVTSTLRSTGAGTSSTYDLSGRLVSKTGENGLTTGLTYDCLGHQMSAQAGGQTATTLSYNSLGWLLTRTDADGTVTDNVHDAAGRVVQSTVAGNTSSTTYDTAGNVTHQVDPGNRWTDTEYDLFGRASRVLQTLPGTPRVTVKDQTTVFDSLGRVVSSADGLQELAQSWTYPLNTASPTTALLTTGSGGDQAQTTLAIGADGLESSRQTVVASSPQIPTVTRTIDTRDNGLRVTAATLDAGGSSAIVSQYLCDAAGRPQRQWGTTGGGSGYTSAAQTTNAYVYDSTSGLKISDNIRLAAVGSAGAITSSYAYSPDGRLTSATTNGFTSGYSFDALGNLTAISPQGGNQTTLVYDGANRLQTALNASGNTYFSWDTTNGRRTSQGPTPNESDPRIRYTYTETGRLATYADETSTPQVSATYSYDAEGQRTQAAVTISGQTTTTSFAYEGLLLVNLSATQTGGTTNDSWQITYLYDENGRPYAGIYRQPGASTQPVVFGIITTDRGDVVSLLDKAGNPFAAYRYDAWGNPQGSGNLGTGMWTQSTTLVSQALADAIATRQPLRYAGYYLDSESGLYYLSARSYDPETAQFISRDPIKSDELSPYQYCGGDPIANIDPSGCLSWSSIKNFFKKIGSGFTWLAGKVKDGWYWVEDNGKKIYFLVMGGVIISQSTAMSVGASGFSAVGGLFFGTVGVVGIWFGTAVLQQGLEMPWQ